MNHRAILPHVKRNFKQGATRQGRANPNTNKQKNLNLYGIVKNYNSLNTSVNETILLNMNKDEPNNLNTSAIYGKNLFFFFLDGDLFGFVFRNFYYQECL